MSVRDRLPSLNVPWRSSRSQQLVTALSVLGLFALFVSAMTLHLAVVVGATVVFEQADVMQRLAAVEQRLVRVGLITPAFTISGSFWALAYRQAGGECDVWRVATAVTAVGTVALVALIDWGVVG